MFDLMLTFRRSFDRTEFLGRIEQRMDREKDVVVSGLGVVIISTFNVDDQMR